MNLVTRERLFGTGSAFEHPVTLWVVVGAGAAIAVALLVIVLLRWTGRMGEKTYRDALSRTLAWLALAPVMIVPVLLGAAWFIVVTGVISLLCYREFARATGLFRHRLISACVVLGIGALTFAVFDHWYGLFAAIPPLTIAVMASVAILPDRPDGYIQRVGLGVFAFLFIGLGLGHLAYLGNDTMYRPIIAWLLLSVELNDVFAYVCGRTLGRHKLAPRTSPNKTVEGLVGAVLLTSTLSAIVASFVFDDGRFGSPVHYVALGLIIAVGGALGDLMLSSIKRDLDIKDMASLIPGHGGVLDRFSSLLLAAPAVFHYLSYFRNIGADQPAQILTG